MLKLSSGVGGPRTVKQRLRGFSDNVMKVATETVGWYATQAAGPPDYTREAPAAWDEAISYVQERESFAGMPGILGSARNRVLDIEDPYVRAQGMSFLNKLQALSPEQQSLVYSYLTGVPTLGDQPATRATTVEPFEAAELVEDLGMAGEITGATTGGEVRITSDRSGMALYAALKNIFPEVDLAIEDESLAERMVNDISDAGADAIMRSSSARNLVGHLQEVAEAEGGVAGRLKEGVRQVLPVFGDITGLWTDVNIMSAGAALDASPWDATGEIADEIRGTWHETEARIGETLVGHWETVNGKAVWNAGPLSFGLNPNDPDFQHNIEVRMGAFTLLGGLGGGGLGVAAGTVGRRLKLTRSVAGNEAAVRAVQAATRTRYARRTGVLGAAAETYRAPARLLTELLDENLLRFRRSPESFFEGAINGRQGRKLMNTLHSAKEAFPGDSAEALNGQVGYVREVYGTQVPDRLVREMLGAESDSAAKAIFVESVNAPGGTVILDKINHRLDAVDARINELGRKPYMTPDESIELASLQIERKGLQYRQRYTADNTPLLRYPTKSTLRAAVRQPTNRLERVLGAIGGGRLRYSLDTAKLVDELPSRPEMIVPQGGSLGPDDLDHNTTILSNYMRRAGVDPKTIQQRIGQLGEITDPQAFYELVEKTIFGEGGDIDRALSASRLAVTPEIRRRIINLHDTPLDSRTLSRVRSYGRAADGSTYDKNTFVLGKRNPDGVDTPLPSRDVEYLDTLRLPDVDLLISATSTLRKLDANIKANAVGATATAPLRAVAWATLRVPTMILKPAVLIAGLPRLAMRIQGEQMFRATQFGFSPFKAMPQGWALFPGGIPVPFSHGRRIGAKLFGERGWNILGPDPSGVHGVLRDPTTAELGMWLEQNTETERVFRMPEDTAPIKSNPGSISSRHLEAGRNELNTAFLSRIDRRLAQLGLNREKYLAWLRNDPWARDFMETRHNGTLSQSSLFQDAERGLPYQDSPLAEVEVDVSFDELSRFGDEADEFVYHVSDIRYGESIGENGLHPRRPAQQWEDGSTEPRLYFTESPERGAGLSSRSRNLSIYRMKRGQQGATSEGAFEGEFFTRDSIPPTAIEYLGEDGNWHVISKPGGLEEATAAWVDNRIAYLRQITGNDPDLIGYVATGRLRTPDGQEASQVDDLGVDIPMQHDILRDELGQLDEGIRGLEAERAASDLDYHDDIDATLNAMHAQRRSTLSMIREIERQHPGVTGGKYVRTDQTRKFNEVLKRKWQENPDTIPPRLMVRQKWDASLDSGGVAADHGRLAAASNALYAGMRPLTWVDTKFTRGSVFGQARARWYDELKARGYSDKDAKAIAHVKAAAQTRDIMYDLTNRTSAQRALKHLFWFAPATQELLYTWLVKIPSQSYWPVGAASLWLKKGLARPLLKQADKLPFVKNLIEEDEDGEYHISIPLVDRILEGDFQSLNFVGGQNKNLPKWLPLNPVPQLGTGGNLLLSQAELKWGGPFKEMGDWLQPYGPESGIAPRQLTYAWEAAFGTAPPWEKMHSGYVQRQFNKSVDLGIRQAYSELWHEGVRPPHPEDYGTWNDETLSWDRTPEEEKAYFAEFNEYWDTVEERGRSMARGTAGLMFLSAILSPAALHVTTADQKMWTKFWNDIYKDGQMTEEEADRLDGLLGENPGSLAYVTSFTVRGDEPRQLPFSKDEDNEFWYDYVSGQREILNPKEYLLAVAANESRRYYQAEQASLNRGKDPFAILLRGYEEDQADARYYAHWKNFLAMHDDVEAYVNKQTAAWKADNNLPSNYEAERLAEAQNLLRQISTQVTGETGYRPEEWRSVMGQIGKMYSEEGDFPAPQTATERAHAWFFSQLDDYFKRVEPLYQQAEQLKSLGLGDQASAIYDQIRRINNQGLGSYKGMQAPSAEEYFFGKKSPVEQQAAINTWASRPITWLSDFQRETVGYSIDSEDAKFLDAVGKFDEWYYDQLQNISPTSKEHDAWEAWRLQRLSAMAVEAGGNAQELLDLQLAKPYTRITETGFGQDVPGWEELNRLAGYVNSSLVASGVSPRGFSEEAITLKSWFYVQLENMRRENPAIRDAFEELEMSFPLDGDIPRRGVVLYEALYFGNFYERGIPPEIAMIGAP